MNDKKNDRKSQKSDGNNKFKESLRGIKIGPICLKCGGPIDTRLGWSVNNQNGTHKDQRHGWLHQDCQDAAQVEFKEFTEAFERDPSSDDFPAYAKLLDGRPCIKVPVYSAEEIEQIIGGS